MRNYEKDIVQTQQINKKRSKTIQVLLQIFR